MVSGEASVYVLLQVCKEQQLWAFGIACNYLMQIFMLIHLFSKYILGNVDF